MSVNVYTGGKLKKISGENITSQKILSAIGYKPAKADTVENHVNNTTIHVTEEDKAYWNDKNYHTLQGAPNIVEDESATLYIADITGNVIAQINEDGVYTTDVLLTTSKKSVLNAINKLENLTYNDLVSKPDIWEEEDGSAEFIIVDEPGNIILKVDNSGLKVKNINDIDFSNFVQSINTFLGELHPIARTGEFDDLENSPIEREVDVDEGSETLKIIDNEGNISLEIDSEATKIDTLKVNTINLKGTNVETELNLKATKNEVESLATALENHKNDNTKEDIYHVTAEEKQYWNKKSEFSGDYNDLENKPIEREDSVEDGTETFKIVDEAGQKALEIDSEATKVQNLQVFGTLKLDGADLGTTIQDINTAIGNRYTKTEADNKFETQTAAQEKYNDATKYTDDEIKELIGSAADDYKTLGGIQSKLEGEIQKIETVISDHKENKNEDIYHVTQKEKDH